MLDPKGKFIRLDIFKIFLKEYRDVIEERDRWRGKKDEFLTAEERLGNDPDCVPTDLFDMMGNHFDGMLEAIRGLSKEFGFNISKELKRLENLAESGGLEPDNYLDDDSLDCFYLTWEDDWHEEWLEQIKEAPKDKEADIKEELFEELKKGIERLRTKFSQIGYEFTFSIYKLIDPGDFTEDRENFKSKMS